MEQALKLKQDVITGFSYSFSKNLLEKLKRLEKEEKFFINDGLSRSVVFYLAKQLKFDIAHSFNAKDVDKLVEVAEEFLAIFEESVPCVSIPTKILEEILEHAELKDEYLKDKDKMMPVLTRIHDVLKQYLFSKKS